MPASSSAVALLLRDARPVRRADRRQAVEEERVGIDGPRLDQRQQDGERLVELALLDQRPCFGGARRGWRLLAPGGGGEGEKGGGRERAEERAGHGCTEKRGRPEGRPRRYAV